jgi:hypothetical protein
MWVVVAELPGSPEQVVAVSLTTRRDGCDTTVILDPDDHKFIVRETVIDYGNTRIFDRNELVDRINKKFFGTNDPFKDDIVKRLQQGLVSSPFTPNGIKTICATIFSTGAPSIEPGPTDSSSEPI